MDERVQTILAAVEEALQNLRASGEIVSYGRIKDEDAYGLEFDDGSAFFVEIQEA